MHGGIVKRRQRSRRFSSSSTVTKVRQTSLTSFACHIQSVLQEVSLLTEDREVLAEKLGSTDAMLNDQFQRFSGVLLLLSTTLSVPDDLLVAVSDVGTDEFDDGMNQVSKI